MELGTYGSTQNLVKVDTSSQVRRNAQQPVAWGRSN